MSSASTHICIVPSRYNFAYSSGSSMASAFNEQTDPGVVYKSFSASQQSSETSVIERVWGDPYKDKSHRWTGCQTAILLNMGGYYSYLYPSV